MHKAFAAALAAVAVTAWAQSPKTEDEKAIYALGAAMGKSARELNLSKSEFEILKKGLSDAFAGGKLEVDFDQYRMKIGPLAQERREAFEAKEIEQKFGKEKGQKLPSGVLYIEQKAGTGAQPTAADTVKVHYRGTLTDGTEFDSSYSRGQPAEFPLGGVVACWTEGVQRMKVGGKAKLVCPSKHAYGERSPSPKIPPNSILVFEIELLEVKGK